MSLASHGFHEGHPPPVGRPAGFLLRIDVERTRALTALANVEPAVLSENAVGIAAAVGRDRDRRRRERQARRDFLDEGIGFEMSPRAERFIHEELQGRALAAPEEKRRSQGHSDEMLHDQISSARGTAMR
ncbi:hypothetical protein D3C86_1495190 [compost metagenome]